MWLWESKVSYEIADVMFPTQYFQQFMAQLTLAEHLPRILLTEHFTEKRFDMFTTTQVNIYQQKNILNTLNGVEGNI